MTNEHTELSERDRQLGEVICACLQAVEAGQALDREQLLARYPQFAAELAEFFAGEQRVERVAAPLRQPPRPASSIPDLTGTTIGDYELLGELGHGGMGVVYRARQKSPQRLVALKLARPGFPATPADEQRFRYEAEAAARLDHPNIVPIYEVGVWRPGGVSPPVPYFCMKLIEGGNLAQAVAGGHWAVDSKEGQRRAVRLLVTVARAVHHAHQCGILHRDLKPSNVLLDGRAGSSEPPTPYITDFGLAKRVASPGQDIGDTPELPGVTETGLAVGTPGYMAPEQASGSRGAATTRTDIHGLGGILYYLLTGRAPYERETHLGKLVPAGDQEPVAPRQRNAHVDRDLETICLKCLRAEPAQRYSSAEAVAEDLERWLRGQPIKARPASRRERLTKWVRRNPALASLLGVIALSLSTLVSGTWVYNARLRAALNEADDARQETEDSYHDARQMVEGMLTRVGGWDLAGVPRMTRVRKEILEDALRFYQKAVTRKRIDPDVRLDTAEAYMRVGVISLMLGQQQQAEEAFGEGVPLLEALAADFSNRPDYRKALAAARMGQGTAYRAASRMKEAEEAYRAALGIQVELAAEFPDVKEYRYDLASNQFNLGHMLEDTGRPSEAEGAFRAALNLREQLADEDRSKDRYLYELAECLDALGGLLTDSQRYLEAEECLCQAVGIGKALVERFPGLPDYSAGLARYSHDLGRVLRNTDRLDAAERFQREALPIQRDLAEAFPEVPEYRQSWANTMDGLGLVLADLKHYEEAEKMLGQAQELRQQLVNQRPAAADLQSELAGTLSNLAEELVVSQTGDLRKACRLLQEAIQHQQAAREKEPRNPTYLRFLVTQHANLAQAEYFLDEHRQATQAATALPRLDPGNPEAWQRAAQCFALCIPLAEKDSKLAADARQATAHEYTQEAMRLLREAVARGYSDGKSLETDDAFEALRSSEDFRKLVAELKTKQK